MSWTVKFTWPAQVDLACAADELASGRELGCTLLGDVDHDRRFVTVSQVRPNAGGAQQVDRTTIDVAAALEHEELCLVPGVDGLEPGCQRQVVCGVAHSHPSGSPALSLHDLRNVRDSANHMQEPWTSVIITAGAERWDGGYPAGPDWEEPTLTAYVAEPGAHAVPQAILIREPKWLWALCAERQEASHAA